MNQYYHGDQQRKLRSGQWTPEEIEFATRLIEAFHQGLLPDNVANGTSMRGYLATKLKCAPKRVSKKYEHTTAANDTANNISNYNGRLQYKHSQSMSAEDAVRCRLHLEQLEKAFHASIQSKKEAVTVGAVNAVEVKEGKQTAKQKKDSQKRASSTREAVPTTRCNITRRNSAALGLLQQVNSVSANLTRSLPARTASNSSSNDGYLLSLLAAHQRLAQLSAARSAAPNLLDVLLQTSLASESAAAVSSVNTTSDILTATLALQQQQQQQQQSRQLLQRTLAAGVSNMTATLSLPPPRNHSANTASAARVLVLERLLAGATSRPTTTTTNTAAAPLSTRFGFEAQARMQQQGATAAASRSRSATENKAGRANGMEPSNNHQGGTNKRPRFI